MTVEESDVEVKETPAAPKSRRGRKGKADQSEAFAVSVSETPLKVVSLTYCTLLYLEQLLLLPLQIFKGGNVCMVINNVSCFCFKTLDTADAADPQESTATDVESTNTRRGGRGRGRKGTAATVKETAQVHSAEYITVLD